MMLTTISHLPTFPWILKSYFLQAHQYVKENKWEEAATLFIFLCRQYPDLKVARFKLAICQMQFEYWEGAKQNLLKLADLHHPDPNVFCNLAIIYWKSKEYKNALTYFKFNLKHFPYHIETRQNLANFYIECNRLKKAIIQYRDILNFQPQNVDIRFNLAATLQQLGVYDEALLHYQNILKTHSQHQDTWYNMACIYYDLKNINAACFCWEKCLPYHPQKQTIGFMLNHIHKKNISASDYYPYVTDLFDHYAKFYEQHLQQSLNYKLPTVIKDYFNSHFSAQHFTSILELGCGTGLCATTLSAYTSKLIGVDISQGMLDKASYSGYYQELNHMDCQRFLTGTKLQFELIIAMDVMPYILDISTLIQEISQHLNSKSQFLFSVEISQEYPYQLQHHGRFSHHPEFIESLCVAQGLRCIHQQKIMIRTENHIPVIGQFYHWEKI